MEKKHKEDALKVQIGPIRIRQKGTEGVVVGPESGEYVAEITSIEKTQTRFGEALRWTFKLQDGSKVTGMTQANASTLRNKLVQWYLHAGGQISPDGTIDLASVVGKKVRVKIEPRGKFGKIVFSNVTEILGPA
jgi:hypothetical protein